MCFLMLFYRGPYIKYVPDGGGRGGGAGRQRDFVGVMEYFRHMLVGHEIFFKIFDGPQNIFLCSFFALLFFKLRWLEHKIFKLAIKEI